MFSHHRNKSGLFFGTPDRFPPASSGTEECWGATHNSKSDIIVVIARIIVVAVGATAFIRIVVPRTAAFSHACPVFYLRMLWPLLNQILDFLWEMPVLSLKRPCLKNISSQSISITMLKMSFPTLQTLYQFF